MEWTAPFFRLSLPPEVDFQSQGFPLGLCVLTLAHVTLGKGLAQSWSNTSHWEYGVTLVTVIS